jgi:hypothetical protein
MFKFLDYSEMFRAKGDMQSLTSFYIDDLCLMDFNKFVSQEEKFIKLSEYGIIAGSKDFEVPFRIPIHLLYRYNIDVTMNDKSLSELIDSANNAISHKNVTSIPNNNMSSELSVAHRIMLSYNISEFCMCYVHYREQLQKYYSSDHLSIIKDTETSKIVLS